MHWTALLAALLVFWSVLSGEASLHNWFLPVAGVATCAGVTALVARRRLLLRDWGLLDLLRAAAGYLPWLLWQVAASNWRVFRIVWSPSLPIAPRVVEVPVTLATPTGRAVFANSITLTPGTVTVDAPPDRFWVHALTEADAAGVSDGVMHDRVAALEPSGRRGS